MDIEKTFALPDEEFIKAMYQELLGREADPDGLRYYLHILRHKRYPRKFVVRSIKDSWEYRLGRARSEIPGLVAENKKLNEQEVAAGKAVLPA